MDMRMILVSQIASILDIKYSQVNYYCFKYHYLGRIKVGNRVYYYQEQAKCVAEKLIHLSSKDLNQVLQEIDEY